MTSNMERTMSKAESKSTISRRTVVMGAAIASVPAVVPDLAAAAGRDPIFAALERCRQMEAICDAEAAAQTDPEDDLAEAADEAWAARMALAETAPTTWAGLLALVTFVAERTAIYDDFYFQIEESPVYAATLAKAVEQLTAKVRL
jgi:hypothetical protein